MEIQAVEDTDDIVAWAASEWKTLSGKIVFSKSNGEAALKHVWFAYAFCTGYKVEFDSTGTTGQSSLRVSFVISPEDMGVEVGSGETWIPPAPREYAAPKPVAAQKRKVTEEEIAEATM